MYLFHFYGVIENIHYFNTRLLQSTGFALIYDSLKSAKQYEPRHRLVRVC